MSALKGHRVILTKKAQKAKLLDGAAGGAGGAGEGSGSAGEPSPLPQLEDSPSGSAGEDVARSNKMDIKRFLSS